MKKLLIIGLIFGIITSFNLQIIPLSNANNTNSEKIELMTGYIKSLKKEVETFKKKYNIENENLEIELSKINDLLNILKNLSKDGSEGYDNEKITLLILEKLKTSKNVIKNIIKIKKTQYEKEFNQKRELYIKISQQLNKQINHLIVEVYNNYKYKEKFSQKEIQIIKILKELNNENVKLKNFGKFVFSSSEEMTDSIIRVLKNTKKLMLELKKIGKNN